MKAELCIEYLGIIFEENIKNKLKGSLRVAHPRDREDANFRADSHDTLECDNANDARASREKLVEFPARKCCARVARARDFPRRSRALETSRGRECYGSEQAQPRESVALNTPGTD